MRGLLYCMMYAFTALELLVIWGYALQCGVPSMLYSVGYAVLFRVMMLTVLGMLYYVGYALLCGVCFSLLGMLNCVWYALLCFTTCDVCFTIAISCVIINNRYVNIDDDFLPRCCHWMS